MNWPRPLAVAIADTSALLAYFNSKDADHDAVVTGIGHVGHLVVSPFVLAELDYLIAERRGPRVARDAIVHIGERVAIGQWEVPGVEPLIATACAILRDYPEIGLTDAMNVALAAKYGTDVIATFDQRHFRMVRPLTRHPAFRLLPYDVPQ